MLVPGQEIEMSVLRSDLVEYYRSKGYDVQPGKKFKIKVEDLTPGSNKKVLVQCDYQQYCNGEPYLMVYKKYYDRVLHGTVHKCACRKCESLKIAESNMINYGMSTNALPEVKQKKIERNQEKYGVNNPMQSLEVQNKFKNTMLDRYGCEYASQSKEIRDKMKNTWIEKYGVDHPAKSNEIIEKRNKGNFEKYGVEHTLQLESVREKIAQSYYKNGTCKASAEQIYLKKLFNADLNYPIGRYNADLLIDDNVVLELDGSGHELNILYGKLTPEEFKLREDIRTKYILDHGYKIIRFLHKWHTHIKDYKYKDALNQCMDKLYSYDIVSYDFDIDKVIV